MKGKDMSNVPVVTIDTGVPVPTEGRRGRVVWPLEQLAVGESFVFPIESRATVASAASRRSRDNDKKFTIKKENDTSCRVWRVK